MALTKCTECGGQMSSLAERCPHCGHPSVRTLFEKLPAEQPARAPLFLALAALCFVLLLATPRIIAVIPALATLGCCAVSILRRERARLAAGVVAALCLGILLLGSSSIGSNASRSGGTNNIAAVEVADWNWGKDPDFGTNGTIKWNVQIRNTSSRNVESVRVEFTTYDAAGKLVSTTFSYVRSIPPGGTRADNSYADLFGTESRAQVQVTDVQFAD